VQCTLFALLLQAVAEMKQKFRPTLMANYVLWPAANLINFAFVPPSQRILYCNVVYVSWQWVLMGQPVWGQCCCVRLPGESWCCLLCATAFLMLLDLRLTSGGH
jgi:hypothetical protein